MQLAYTGPLVVAPAMNTNMWDHPATRKNMETLRGRGVIVVEPEAGELACGTVGPGRLANIEKIALAADQALGRSRDLAGETVSHHRRPHARNISIRYVTFPTVRADAWALPSPPRPPPAERA